MAKAYVLIKASHATMTALRDQMRALKPQVLAADTIMGPYDLVAVVAGADVDEIGHLIIHQIQPLDGVQRTLTCMVIGAD